MKITYDKEVDAMYIYFRKGKVEETREVNADTFIDLDKDEHILGLELLNASRYFAKKGRAEISIGQKSVKIPALANYK